MGRGVSPGGERIVAGPGLGDDAGRDALAAELLEQREVEAGGASRRELSDPQGVRVGGATSDAPAATARSVASPASPTSKRDPEAPRDPSSDLHVVDRPRVPGEAISKRRPPDVEDRHPVVLAVRVGDLLGRPRTSR